MDSTLGTSPYDRYREYLPPGSNLINLSVLVYGNYKIRPLLIIFLFPDPDRP